MNTNIKKFTKIQREAVQLCLDAYETEEWMGAGSIGIQRLIEACDIIDNQVKKIEELEKGTQVNNADQIRQLLWHIRSLADNDEPKSVKGEHESCFLKIKRLADEAITILPTVQSCPDYIKEKSCDDQNDRICY